MLVSCGLSFIIVWAMWKNNSLILWPVFADVSKKASPCSLASCSPLSVSTTRLGRSVLLATRIFATSSLAWASIYFSQFRIKCFRRVTFLLINLEIFTFSKLICKFVPPSFKGLKKKCRLNKQSKVFLLHFLRKKSYNLSPIMSFTSHSKVSLSKSLSH